MSLTVNAKSYLNDVARGSDSFRYLHSTLHTASHPDMVDLYRTPAPSGVDGTTKYKGRVKLTRGCTNGTVELAGDIIIDIVMSVPTTCASAEIDSAINDLAAFMATSTVKSVVKAGIINV
jgi:hypothetical protein